MERHEVEDISVRIEKIIEAVQVLSRNPLMGRPVKNGKRELVIGKGRRGCVALYRYLAKVETVLVLALQARRESSFKH